jgi:hypothetical protein
MFGSEAIHFALMGESRPFASTPWARTSTVFWALAPA